MKDKYKLYDSEGDWRFIRFEKVKGEPGDFLWENIYVGCCEMFVRKAFY